MVTLADRHGFAAARAEGSRCAASLVQSEDFTRATGEPLSIREMVDWMIANHGIDRRRVYVTGVSSGAAMTSVILATYPEAFAGGAIIAGVPYGAPTASRKGSAYSGEPPPGNGATGRAAPLTQGLGRRSVWRRCR
jgi:poly(hydroxyalkanoate) depolymerase family esterase